MSFVTITTWRMTTETESLQHVKELMSRKYFPGLLALGAKHSMLMDAGLDRFAIVTIYPSQEVRDDAIAHISALRGEGAEEFGAELMDTYAGALLAASDDEPGDNCPRSSRSVFSVTGVVEKNCSKTDEILSRVTGFATNSSIPASIHSFRSSGKAFAVRPTIRAEYPRVLAICVAVTPSIIGICKSMTTKS